MLVNCHSTRYCTVSINNVYNNESLQQTVVRTKEMYNMVVVLYIICIYILVINMYGTVLMYLIGIEH